MAENDGSQENGFSREYWALGRPIVLHALILLTLLAIFLGVYGLLRVFAAAGVPKDRIEIFDTIDFYGTVAVLCVLALDLLIKAVVISIKPYLK